MLRRLFLVMQSLALLLPAGVFLTYIIAAEGDQWTSEHFLATGLSSIPLIVILLLKFIVYGGNET